MSHPILVVLLAALVFVLFITTRYIKPHVSTHTPTPTTSPTARLDSSWQLVFSDEFNGSELDTTKWITSFPWGRSGANPDELQYYAEDAFEFANGIHRIRAEKRSMAGYEYTSGIITSYGKFHLTYGYIEIRAKIPQGKGLWPAFWLLPVDQDWPPEIDVFEILGHETNTVYMTNHWSSETEEHVFVQEVHVGSDFSQGFHTFAVEWGPSEIIWYIDGVERFRSNQGIPAEPMYLLVNLAVGGEWPGNPDETTPFPAYLEIDYVRAYQRSYGYHLWLPIILNAPKTSS